MTIFEEDFKRERSDRERMNEEKEELKQQLEQLQSQLAQAKSQVIFKATVHATYSFSCTHLKHCYQLKG